ncbi:helix-turn-helix domain-containing protein [Paenibacillus sp. J5C_2022]|uniref:helix-turn-helix domain-containing protein n=1 Tax=Paenibacillus sp. J5C2022 TaxID=2977129 RepID=UPI0021D3075B|nr:helix-turn-helix domain-containing protein [Paenibacillus sp. J5C2022]MCU6712101.1 helix-turn-helix domain-containing protein [Paenibacillus sp. J5C2022]
MQKQRTVRTDSLFVKHLVSYIAILLVPFLILGGLIYFYFINIIKQDILAANLTQLERTQDDIDDKVRQIRIITNQLSINQHLKPFLFLDDPLHSTVVVEELKEYKITHDFIADILLYHRSDDYIYTSTGSNSLPMLLASIYRYENWSLKDFTEAVNTIAKPEVRTMDMVYSNDNAEPVKYVTFLSPLSYNGFKATRTVLFLVPEQAFHSVLATSMQHYNGNTAVFDEQGNIVSALSNASYLHSDQFRQALQQSASGTNRTLTLDGRDYLFSYLKSEDTRWTYMTLVPVSEVMQRITSLKLLFIFVLCSILVIGGAIIYYLMGMNYRPIRRLKQYADGIWSDHTPRSNELESVQHAIAYLNNQNTELHARIEDGAVAAKEYFLFQVLKGKFGTLEQLRDSAKEINLTITKPWLRAVVFQLGYNGMPDIDAVLTAIEQALPDELEGYARDHTDQNKLVLVLASEEREEARLSDIFSGIQEQLLERFQLHTTVGIGTAYRDVPLIPRSYIEGMSAVDYRLVKGTGRVIFWRECASDAVNLDAYPQLAAEKLKLYIRQGDIDEIERVLQSIIHFLKHERPSLFIVKLIGFEMISAVIQTIKELNKQQYHLPLDYPDVFLLAEYESVEELVETVKQLSRDISESLEKIKRGHNGTLLDNILGYIQEHYMDFDYSVQQVADHFHMSQASLSQLFKEQTGTSLLEYEIQLKLDKAKQLLVTSKLPLKDIATEVGYFNVNSFIRRFKQSIGITPGEYRKQHQL